MDSDVKKRVELMREYAKIPMELVLFRMKLSECKEDETH